MVLFLARFLFLTTYKQAFSNSSNQAAPLNLSQNFLVFQFCTSFVRQLYVTFFEGIGVLC